MDNLVRPSNRVRTFRAVVFVLVALIADANAQRVVEQKVEPSDVVTVGDRLTLVLTVETLDDTEPQPAIPAENGNERAWGLPTVERAKRQSATTLWTVRVPFQVFRVGDVAIPALDLAVGGTILSSKPAKVTVRTVREGDDANDLRDVRPPVRLVGFPWGWLVACAGIAVVAFLWRRMRRPRREASTVEPNLSPEEWLETEFSRLEAMPVGDTESLRRLVAATADVVRCYLERKAGVPAPSRTTRLTLDAVAPILTRETRHRLEEILQAADFVKFAGHAPVAEVARLYLQRARETVGIVADEFARRPTRNEIAS